MSGDEFTDFYISSFSRVAGAVSVFCGNRDLAYEATQEAFARAFARWPRVREADFPEGWVSKTAMNLTRRNFRRGMVSARPPKDGETAEPSGDRLDVLRAVRALPPRQRQAIVLYYFVDSNVSAVADVMGLSEGAVKAHLHRGRAALKKPLEVRHV